MLGSCQFQKWMELVESQLPVITNERPKPTGGPSHLPDDSQIAKLLGFSSSYTSWSFDSGETCDSPYRAIPLKVLKCCCVVALSRKISANEIYNTHIYIYSL